MSYLQSSELDAYQTCTKRMQSSSSPGKLMMLDDTESTQQDVWSTIDAFRDFSSISLNLLHRYTLQWHEDPESNVVIAIDQRCQMCSGLCGLQPTKRGPKRITTSLASITNRSWPHQNNYFSKTQWQATDAYPTCPSVMQSTVSAQQRVVSKFCQCTETLVTPC